MVRQYGAQRFRPSLPMRRVERTRKRKGVSYTEVSYAPQENDFGYKHRVGTIPIGTIVYIQDDHRPFGGCTALQFRPRRDCCKNPWIVVAWLNREYYPAVKGNRRVKYMAGGDLAVVKSLRDGRVKKVADWILLQCVELDLVKE